MHEHPPFSIMHYQLVLPPHSVPPRNVGIGHLFLQAPGWELLASVLEHIQIALPTLVYSAHIASWQAWSFLTTPLVSKTH